MSKKQKRIRIHIDCKIYIDVPKKEKGLKKKMSNYLTEIIRQAEIETR